MLSKILVLFLLLLIAFVPTLQASYDVWLNQSGNFVMASPNGSTGNMSPRALVVADIPALPYASSTLTSTHFYVGNGSNVATDTAMSGDATLSNTGAVTLANTAVTAGSYTYSSITVDSKGRLTAASNGAPPIAPSTKAKTTAYTAVANDVVLANATGGAFAVTLPLCASNLNAVISVKKTDSSANAVTITANVADTIDGQATQPISTQYDNVQMICDGSTHWYVL